MHSLDPTDPAIVAATVINVGNIGTHALSGLQGRLAGFTFKGNLFGAISLTSGTLEYCHIVSNQGVATSSLPDAPRLAAVSGVHGIIQYNRFEQNEGQFGGALCNVRDGIIQNNLFVNNVALRLGGVDAGGAAMYACRGIIRNNTIVNNVIRIYSGGPTTGGWIGGGLYDCNASFLNNILWVEGENMTPEYGNTQPPRFSIIKDWSGDGEGNSNQDPRLRHAPFIYSTSGLIPGIGELDYRLRPDSPAIDAGQTTESLSTDIKGTTRGKVWRSQGSHGDGSHTDIGAYEFDSEPITLWLPKENDPAMAGSHVPVHWTLAPDDPGGIYNLRLERGNGTQISDLGIFFFPDGHSYLETAGVLNLALPLTDTANDYVLRMLPKSAGPSEGISPPFTIILTNAVDAQNWANYQ